MLVVNAVPPRRELPLQVTTSHVGRRFVLAVSGEIDIASAPLIGQRAGIAFAEGAQELWIDLTEVEFVDVIGVHALLDLDELAAGEGRRLAVICPGGHVRRAFELTGATDRLPLFESRFDAHRVA
jgi:anti-sigma B factor antagonist